MKKKYMFYKFENNKICPGEEIELSRFPNISKMKDELKKISVLLRQYRKRNKLSLRSFCQKYKLDSITISRLERGLEDESDFKYFLQAIKKIKEIKDKNISIIECPKCGESLHFSKNELNGHIWGKCETKDCLGWMQ